MGLISPLYGKPRRPANNAAAGAIGIPKPVSAHEKPLPAPMQGRVWLRVPFGEKDHAKATGARWDPQAKFWYVNSDRMLAGFERWLPQERRR